MGRNIARKEYRRILRKRYADFYIFVRMLTFKARFDLAWRILFKKGELHE